MRLLLTFILLAGLSACTTPQHPVQSSADTPGAAAAPEPPAYMPEIVTGTIHTLAGVRLKYDGTSVDITGGLIAPGGTADFHNPISTATTAALRSEGPVFAHRLPATQWVIATDGPGHRRYAIIDTGSRRHIGERVALVRNGRAVTLMSESEAARMVAGLEARWSDYENSMKALGLPPVPRPSPGSPAGHEALRISSSVAG